MGVCSIVLFAVPVVLAETVFYDHDNYKGSKNQTEESLNAGTCCIKCFLIGSEKYKSCIMTGSDEPGD
jgi:hypothetical protein